MSAIQVSPQEMADMNIWLARMIVLLVLPPVAIFISCQLYLVDLNSFRLVKHDLGIELLVIVITWWYHYQSYRVRKGGIDLGQSISSLLVYNGSIYFLFLASLYTIDIIFQTASVPESASYIDGFLELFYDPLSSILVCRFMLSLRRFDASIVSATNSGIGSRVRDHTASTLLQFGAQPSESLPAFITSFAHPVHVDWSLSEAEADAIVDDGSESREMDAMATRLETLPSGCYSDPMSEGQPAKPEA
ncbi:hypothetical protein GSI_04952 [Ganoderma sinense ZZ0214-1]|uniref:Uncharacterized protein n=1 Tax=Ganoderma sinense ZZ0214-1 TaxID=1077348 RepID=A0A2G8SGC7_9APHY|nr:hypothetical protein GSI_04952 [Ganoderma sinense ZZ0214-1]